MEYQIEESQETVTVKLKGDMYLKAVARLREDLLQRIAAGKRFYAFDMSELRYIDSAGLGLLVTVQKRVAPKDGMVSIRGLQGVIKELFEQTRLDRVFFIE